MDLDAVDWSDVAAWVALALAVGSLLHRWYAGRAASLLIRSCTPRASRQLQRTRGYYNDRPARAREVALRCSTRG